MFIIWGFGRQTRKSFGFIDYRTCGRCHNTVQCQMLKITTWFTLFFIPVIPYGVKRYIACPICGAAQELSKEEFESLVQSGKLSPEGGPHYAPQRGASAQDVPDDVKYAGKTPTQIAYLKQMEEFAQQQAQNNQN